MMIMSGMYALAYIVWLSWLFVVTQRMHSGGLGFFVFVLGTLIPWAILGKTLNLI